MRGGAFSGLRYFVLLLQLGDNTTTSRGLLRLYDLGVKLRDTFRSHGVRLSSQSTLEMQQLPLSRQIEPHLRVGQQVQYLLDGVSHMFLVPEDCKVTVLQFQNDVAPRRVGDGSEQVPVVREYASFVVTNDDQKAHVVQLLRPRGLQELRVDEVIFPRALAATSGDDENE